MGDQKGPFPLSCHSFGKQQGSHQDLVAHLELASPGELVLLPFLLVLCFLPGPGPTGSSHEVRPDTREVCDRASAEAGLICLARPASDLSGFA